LPSFTFKLAQRLTLGNSNVFKYNLTANLSGNFALHTALKVLINTNYTNIFDGNGYLAIYTSLGKRFTNDCQNRMSMHVEKLLKE
jgi:hypothetical protein